MKDINTVEKHEQLPQTQSEIDDESFHMHRQHHQSKPQRQAQKCRNYSPGHNCPAKHSKCNYCNITGHFSKVCRSRLKDMSNNMENKSMINSNKKNRINHINNEEDPYNQDESIGFLMVGTLKTENNALSEITINIEATLKDGSIRTNLISALPDTGANLCLLGPKQLKTLGVGINEIEDSHKSLNVAGGTQLQTTKQFPAVLRLNEKSARVTILFCKSASRLFISRQACIDLGIVPTSFPYPMGTNANICAIQNANTSPQTSNKTNDTKKPPCIPVPPTEENVPKLRQYLIERFTQKVFSREKPFPKLSTPPAQIHLREGFQIPKPAYTPAPVAEHWAARVKEALDKDVESGILLRVPLNEPTVWCARMVVVRKKDGSPRRTVDYQSLNKQCVREPIYSASPFHTARKIPQQTYKSIFDAVDGYHSVEIDESSSKLTTFITPWGRYRYLRFPQGHCAAGDAFNGRVESILSNIPRLARIVDDMCLYDNSIEEMFWHSWDLLETCAKHGIVLNESKFQFCQKIVEFAGLTITADSVQPSEKILAAIKNFPPPKDLTQARAFFGLTNQVQWAYANSPEMSPFRDLVKPHSTFVWTDELKVLFNKCKSRIIDQVKEGVTHFDLNRKTCLQTDFSKSGLGYLLLQKYCPCTMDRAPVCCKDGWRLIFAGSRFTKGAERTYAPTEGELLAIAWALNHSHLFTKGSPNLYIVTDHKPLLGILNSKPFNDIKNPRILRLKEQTLQFDFSISYNKGKWQRGPDALSRSPQCFSLELFHTAHEEEPEDETPCDDVALAELNEITAGTSTISLRDIREETQKDGELTALTKAIQQGFPASHDDTDPLIQQYFPVRNELSLYSDGVIMFQSRILVPKALRRPVLEILHHAHQGVEGMRSRAKNTVYWPGLNSSIRRKREECSICNELAPSQAREPLKTMPQPEFPFQYLCMDAFEINGQHYLAAVDKFSSWLLVYHCRGAITSNTVISKLRLIFQAYGAAEKLYTDNGLPFSSQQVTDFLSRWRVQHITSSALYPQGNGRAELAVKTAKRIICNNTGIGGSLDCDRAARALLQYRNTPIKYLGLSPAQLLFQRDLRDSLPTIPTRLRLHRQWAISADEREKAFQKRNEHTIQRYNQNTRGLVPLPEGCEVCIQDVGVGKSKRWNRYGTVLGRVDRKYTIRIHGSNRVVTRNRRFIKPVVFKPETSV